jgi:hypothetical protein
MKRYFIFFVIVLILPVVAIAWNVSLHGSPQPNTGGGSGGTDWTADSNMIALYNFEDGNFSSGTVDSDGNNDMGLGSYEAPTVNTTNYIEGSQSATFDAAGTDNSFEVSQSGLDAGFPGNGTGDNEITVAGWIRITTYGADNYWFAIRDFSPYTVILSIYESAADGSMSVYFDGTGGSATVTSTVDCSTNTWYFVALSYSDQSTTLAIYVREYGSGSSTWTENTSADFDDLEDISSSGTVYLGNCETTFAPYGDADAWAVFNGDALTQTELDGVFTNGWDGNGW